MTSSARTDHRVTLQQAYRNAVTIIEGVQPSALSSPTPCAEYDVSRLVDHLVGAARRAEMLGRGEVSWEEFPHTELAAAAEEVRRSAKEAEAAWSDDASVVRTTAMPWGETYTGATLVEMYAAELAAHTWDLAAATDQIGSLDPALAVPALEAARAMLQPAYRNAMGPGNPFGSEVVPDSDASDWDRFAAFMGRDPHWG